MNTHRTTSHSFFVRTYRMFEKNTQQVGLVVGLVVLFMSIACGYMLWINEQNKAAQRYFGALIMEYNQAKQEKDADWDTLLKKFERGYQKHVRSSMLPYYKEYTVDILLKQNKKEEALELLNTIITESQASPLLPLYKLEQALVSLDMQDTEMKRLAEDMLVALANDQANQFRDSAQFYLGRYYWTHDNADAAREVWQKLVDEQAHEKAAPSPWVHEVKQYLS